MTSLIKKEYVSTLQLMLLASLIYAGAGNAGQKVAFHYSAADKGGVLTCNKTEVKDINKIPSYCEYVNGELLLNRVGWSDKEDVNKVVKRYATLMEDGTKAGDCAGSVIPNPNPEVKNDYSLAPVCIKYTPPPPAPYTPPGPATGKLLFEEWYTDLPWNQKLSTKDSNLFKAPFMLPFAALNKSLCQSTKEAKDRARCMLRYGVVNVMAMHRTDTSYNPEDLSKDQANCQGKDSKNDNCVEVNIKISRLHTSTNNEEGWEADTVRNNRHEYERYDPKEKKYKKAAVPSLGYAINEATIFAPWRPWYTGHYCAKDADHKADAVCYEDYFTTQLQALIAGDKEVWLRDNPAAMIPRGTEPNFLPYCKKGEKVCNMFLGKVDFIESSAGPVISGCRGDPLEDCRENVLDVTDDLDDQFNRATDEYYDAGRYPWDDEPYFDLSADTAEIDSNPFIGFYSLKKTTDDAGGKPKSPWFKGTRYVLPNKCTKEDYQGARHGDANDIQALEKCVLNFEVHTTGFYEQWRWLWGGDRDKIDINQLLKAMQGLDASQYGRTNFFYAGVPGQHLPVSFKQLDDGMSVHDKIYNAGPYIQYLPMVNPADQNLATKSYTNDFWHAFLMSNHMNQTPDHFIRGVRGRVLWHNEYRSDILYKADTTEHYKTKDTKFADILGHVDFPAGFQVKKAKAPFHGNTCDACHIRNGSGVPLMPNGKLPDIHIKRGMKNKEPDVNDPHYYKIDYDYTYSNPELPSMKMVLVDLEDKSASAEYCDDNNNSVPKLAQLYSGEDPADRYYTNKIMNFYGNSFHVNQEDRLPTYSMKYVDITKGDGFEIVVDDNIPRGKIKPNPLSQQEGTFPYKPRRVEISKINASTACKSDTDIAAKPDSIKDGNSWPANCGEVSGSAISEAIKNHKIGFIHLLGRRLGNTPMIEMIPDKKIKDTQQAQASSSGYPGCISLSPGTRSGAKGEVNYRNCSSDKEGDGMDDCYIGRWGWIGDRASLEDQIANAAIVEMNMTSKDSYKTVHGDASDSDQLVRYNKTLCGPADAGCKKKKPNSDITEQEIKDMATYQRWIGIPNRSEYQVSSDQVQKGEVVFRDDLECNSCHVIDKIPFVVNDNMLPDEERVHLETLQIEDNGQADYPFISYLGTDLLLHDMGYLSQVAKAPEDEEGNQIKIRDKETGLVKQGYENYIQRIRTPALKGLRFNRFVTDSNHNTTRPIGRDGKLVKNAIPGCDFLLHDGRACDAIEAAYLHDGPAIKKMDTINKLNDLRPDKLEQLRAFLYSL